MICIVYNVNHQGLILPYVLKTCFTLTLFIRIPLKLIFVPSIIINLINVIYHTPLHNARHTKVAPSRYKFHRYQFVFKCINFNYPCCLKQFFFPYTSNYILRPSDRILLIVPYVSKQVVLFFGFLLIGKMYL